MKPKHRGFIHIPVFILAFAIGAFFVYLKAPDKKTVWLYPSRREEYQYKNPEQKCFKPEFEDAECGIFAKEVT